MPDEIVLALFVLLIVGGGWLLGVIAFFRGLGRSRDIESRVGDLSFLIGRLSGAIASLQDRISVLEKKAKARGEAEAPRAPATAGGAGEAMEAATPPLKAAAPGVPVEQKPALPPEPEGVAPEAAAAPEAPAEPPPITAEAPETVPPRQAPESVPPRQAPETVPPRQAPETVPPQRGPETGSPQRTLERISAAQREQPAAPAPGKPPVSFEFFLGAKGLLWAGAALVLIGVAYFVKFAYDNNWIGPGGRLMIGAALGIAAILQGERFRRKAWDRLFHAFTGMGLAIFYICIYFSFQVYRLSGQGLSFGLASAVTALAITLAVGHNAVPIALVAVVGGFLSPVLLSTGENHPYALFVYILILDLVAMGAALFRRWRALDVVCFAGTAIMYSGWHAKFGSSAGQMTPALIFASLFYLVFLLVPTLYSLVRRVPEKPEGVFLVAGNTFFWLLMYYRILYSGHPQMLGFVCLAQAVLMFLLFRGWVNRVGASTRTAEALLIITLGLVTAAVPLHLKLYGIPIVWGLEGALLAYAGMRFNQAITRVAGVAALLLAAFALWNRMPLHSARFAPVLNIPFGSWALVSAAGFAAARLHSRGRGECEKMNAPLAALSFIIAFILGCIALTAETGGFWRHDYSGTYRDTHAHSSFAILWSLIPAGVVTALLRKRLLMLPWEALAWCCYAAGGLVFLVALGYRSLGVHWLFLNAFLLPRLVFVLSLWWGARCFRSAGNELAERYETAARAGVLEAAGHVALALLLAAEFSAWSRQSELVSSRMGLSLISAAWALQGFTLIWLGLATRRKLRRIIGFVLFGITMAKVLVVDTSGLEKAFRILSFISCGLLAVATAVLYQKFSPMLLREQEEEQ